MLRLSHSFPVLQRKYLPMESVLEPAILPEVLGPFMARKIIQKSRFSASGFCWYPIQPSVMLKPFGESWAWGTIGWVVLEDPIKGFRMRFDNIGLAGLHGFETQA